MHELLQLQFLLSTSQSSITQIEASATQLAMTRPVAIEAEGELNSWRAWAAPGGAQAARRASLRRWEG